MLLYLLEISVILCCCCCLHCSLNDELYFCKEVISYLHIFNDSSILISMFMPCMLLIVWGVHLVEMRLTRLSNVYLLEAGAVCPRAPGLTLVSSWSFRCVCLRSVSCFLCCLCNWICYWCSTDHIASNAGILIPKRLLNNHRILLHICGTEPSIFANVY